MQYASFLSIVERGITLDRYGHLFPGAESEAAALFDACLARALGQSRGTNGPSEASQGGAQLTLPDSAERFSNRL
jgi:uncharacterized protein (DUF2336 family)